MATAWDIDQQIRRLITKMIDGTMTERDRANLVDLERERVQMLCPRWRPLHLRARG